MSSCRLASDDLLIRDDASRIFANGQKDYKFGLRVHPIVGPEAGEKFFSDREKSSSVSREARKAHNGLKLGLTNNFKFEKHISELHGCSYCKSRCQSPSKKDKIQR